MRYLFKSTYTPDDPASDRRRQRTVMDANDPVHAIRLSLSQFGLNSIRDEAVAEHPVLVDSVACGWPVVGNSGTYYFEIDEFEVSDPVTPDAVLVWAQETTDGSVTQVHEALVNLLGRAYWRMIGQWKAFELKQTLHELVVENQCHKSYRSLDIPELIHEVMHEVVQAQRDNYDEYANGRPFGFAAMLDDCPQLWRVDDSKE